MKNSEITKLLALLGHCNYNDSNKREFARLAKKLLRAVNAQLNLDADIRFCAGGIAVSGEAILHADKVYVQVSADRRDPGIMYRACNGRKDYTGMRNLWLPYGILQRDGISALVRAIAAVIPHLHECPKCGDILTCNDPRCAIPQEPIAECGAH